MTIISIIALYVLTLASTVTCFVVYHKTVKDLTNKLMARNFDDVLAIKQESASIEDTKIDISEEENEIPVGDASAEEIITALGKDQDE